MPSRVGRVLLCLLAVNLPSAPAALAQAAASPCADTAHAQFDFWVGEWDVTRHESYRLSEVLNSKGIQHWLDDGKWRGHDWNYWQDMLPYYLSLL